MDTALSRSHFLRVACCPLGTAYLELYERQAMSDSQISRSAESMVRRDEQGGFPAQQQEPPGLTDLMKPRPDHGESPTAAQAS